MRRFTLILAIVYAFLTLANASASDPPRTAYTASSKNALSPEQQREIDRLIRELESTSFKQREDASRGLNQYGHAAISYLRRKLNDSSSAEVRLRIQATIQQLQWGALRMDAAKTADAFLAGFKKRDGRSLRFLLTENAVDVRYIVTLYPNDAQTQKWSHEVGEVYKSDDGTLHVMVRWTRDGDSDKTIPGFVIIRRDDGQYRVLGLAMSYGRNGYIHWDFETPESLQVLKQGLFLPR